MRAKPSELIAVVGVVLLLAGCGGSGKSELERRYDGLKLDMTAEQVTAVMGEGKPVTAAEIAAYPESPKLDMTGLPGDARWVRWGDGVPYVLAGFSNDRLVLAQLTGAAAPKRLGR
jgi:hypothetical protein